ncbi:MAG: amidohydrolase [Gemmatimonadaceae bacterium]
MSPNLRQVHERRKSLRGVACLCLVVVAGCRTDVKAPNSTLLFSGGTILTFDTLHPVVPAVSVRDGRVEVWKTGGDGERSGGQKVDLQGAVLAPAFHDHHVHLFNLGLALLNDRDHERLFVDLSSARSLSDVYEKVRIRASRTAPGAWIVGAGWNQATWGLAALPSADTLNRAAPDHPVFLSRSDGHAGWVNARALAAAHLDAQTVAPDGGAIMRGAHGDPTGVLLERANERVIPLLPALADSDVIAAYQLGAAALAARGVTKVYDAGALAPPGVVALNIPFERFLRLLVRADSLSPLPVQVNLMIPAPSALADSLLAAPIRRWELSPRLRITHLKLFADGALGSRGASLSHPYADDPTTRGVARMRSDAIAGLATKALDAGLGVATHAIGDDAVHRTLDAYAQVLAARPQISPRRLRIEHFSYVQERDVARALALGVVLSIQSGFNSGAHDDPPFGAARVGAENEPRVYPWRRLAKANATLAEGSDYFSRPEPALYALQAALTRRYGMATELPDSVARVLAYQFESRWFDPDGLPHDGRLTSDSAADFVVLSRNPLTVPIDELASVTVLATVHLGRVTYVAPNAPMGLQALKAASDSPRP